MNSDRRVHARKTGGHEVVRYNRAGKWYYEHPEGRSPLTVTEAVELALTSMEWEVIPGVPGGRRFDFLFDSRLA